MSILQNTKRSLNIFSTARQNLREGRVSFSNKQQRCFHHFSKINQFHHSVTSPFNIHTTTKNLPFRTFFTAPAPQSHIGRTPILYPPEVILTHDKTPITNPRVPSDLNSTTLTVSGPLGTHQMSIKPYVRLIFEYPTPILIDDALPSSPSTTTKETKLLIEVENHRIKEQRQMWGTTRALIANYITGVSEGFTVPLRLAGVGYRANLENNKLVLRVGYAHTIELDIPEGVQCAIPTPSKIVLRGTDKRAVTQFAADIRKWRKPEPYNQKGIFVGGETIKKKISRKK